MRITFTNWIHTNL